jgi:cytochrome oxidase Cu insertion factor (SCO1/SenC/PrrC family)
VRASVGLALLALLAVGAAPARAQDLDDLLLDMQMVVLDGQTPPAFALDVLDGGTAALTDFAGKVVMLYFWESG